MPIDALSVLCAQLTRDLLAIAKFLFPTISLNCCCGNCVLLVSRFLYGLWSLRASRLLLRRRDRRVRMALNGLFCVDMLLSTYSLCVSANTQSLPWQLVELILLSISTYIQQHKRCRRDTAKICYININKLFRIASITLSIMARYDT